MFEDIESSTRNARLLMCHIVLAPIPAVACHAVIVAGCGRFGQVSEDCILTCATMTGSKEDGDLDAVLLDHNF